MSEKVLKLGIKKEPGYLYYLNCSICRKKKWVSKKCKTPDKHLWDVWRANMKYAIPAEQKKEHGLYKRARIQYQKGYLYFVDKDGDISRHKL